VTKLQSLVDRPATKDDVGKKIYYMGTNNRKIVSKTITDVIDVKGKSAILTGSLIWRNDNETLFWQKPILNPESELSKLRDLLDEAREIINYVAGNDKQYSMKLKAENWLKDLSEVCGE
jgi:hypothetical protein